MAKSYYSIMDKVKKLINTEGQDAAVEYLRDLLNDPDTYTTLDEWEISNLIEQNELNNDLKIDLLCEDALMDYLTIPLEKYIFLSIIRNRLTRAYVYNENFMDLMYRHSNIKNMIDDNYANAILEQKDYLAPYAIFYVLSSVNISSVHQETIAKLLDAYELDESTMYTEVLTLLRSEAFVAAVSYKQLETLVNRVSLNLPSKESKKFITEVLKIPAVKRKYDTSGRFFNFKYMDGLKESHILPLLMKKGYYNSSMNVTDKEKAFKMIEYFYNQDPTFFSYFNYRLLNDNVMQLDEDLLFGLLKSDQRNKLATLGNTQLGKVFVECANYLNERYPNSNVATLINILENRNIPDFVVRDYENLDVAMLTHFLLNNHHMSISHMGEYEYRIMEDLDASFKSQTGNMSAFKNALCMNRYGFSYQQVQDMYRQFGTFVESCDNKEVQKEFKEFEDIIFGKDKSVLYRRYMTNIFSFDKTNKYLEDLKRLYSSQLDDAVFSQKDLVINDEMFFEGECVPVVRVKDDFLGLISVVGFVTKLDMIGDDYKKSLLDDPKYEIHALSASLYSRANPSRVGGQLILGYSDFGPDAIQAAAPTDIFSTASRYGIYADYTSAFVPADELPEYTIEDYNELLIERRVRDKNSPNHLANIYPSYIFLDDEDPNRVRTAIKASKDLGIPIVFFDRRESWNDYKKEYQELYRLYEGKSADELIDLAKRLFAIVHKHDGGKMSDLRRIVDKFLKNVKDPEELEKVEGFLLREINKGSDHRRDVLYDCLVKVRQHRASKVEFPTITDDPKESMKISKEINEAIMVGVLSHRYDGKCLADAYALTHACLYLYKHMPEFQAIYPLDKVMTSAILLSALKGDFIYDYRKSTDEKDSTADSHDFGDHFVIFAGRFPSLAKKCPELSAHQFRLGQYCLKDPKDMRRFMNIALSVVEGEGLNEIAKQINVDVVELLEFREKLISIYSNDAKKVASKKK